MKGVLLAAALAVAQQTVTPRSVFRSGVELVEIDVSVTRNGQPVQGLISRDFVLTDDGAAQEVDTVLLDQLPLSVTLALDTSRSVSGDRLAHLVAAGVALTHALHAEDRAALLTFSQAVNLRVPMTGDMATIQRALGTIAGGGGTALRDAVHVGLELRAQDRSRPLLLVFTDGRDTASWLTEDAVLDTARRAAVVTQVVSLEGDAFLDELVALSGGRTWSATSDRQLRDLFTHALDDMRARYLLTYTPQGAAKPGWHSVKVKLKDSRADITARPGYFVAK